MCWVIVNFVCHRNFHKDTGWAKKRSKFETRPFKIYTFVLIQQTHEENAVLRVLANVSFQRGELGNEGNGDYTGEGATGDPTNEQTEGVETC